MFEHESGADDVGVEVADGIAAIGAESDDNDAIRAHMCSDMFQHSSFGAECEEGHDVASQDGCVEEFRMANRSQIELGEVCDEPPRPGMIRFRGGDQFRVEVHADDMVTALGQFCADTPRPAAGIEDP